MPRVYKKMPEAEKLGLRLQKCREKKKITQQEMADACGVSKNYISAIERGINKMSVFTFAKYCEKCGITPNDILLPRRDRVIPELENTLLELTGDEQLKVLECIRIMFDLK